MIDKKTFLAFILIAAVMVIWTVMVPQPAPQPVQDASDIIVKDVSPETETVRNIETPQTSDYVDPEYSVSKIENQILFTISTPLYEAVVSNKRGGSIQSFVLKNYYKYDSSFVNLVSEQNLENLLISGTSIESGPFVLDNNWSVNGVSNSEFIDLESGSKTVYFNTILDGREVSKSLTFKADTYLIDTQLDLSKVANILTQGSFVYQWKGGVPGTEKNLKDDATYFKGYIYQGDEVIEPDIDDYEEVDRISYNGQTGWVATRTKYFISALIPAEHASGAVSSGIYLDKKEYHDVGLLMDASKPQTVSLFLGPLEFKRVRGLGVGLQKTMSLGFAPIRPISRGVLWLMQQLYIFIPNYGLVLIVFSILVKLATFPLTKKSYESTRKMQEIQPLINDLRTKHKNDPQKLNKATMALYKEYGVNPLGGCLPILLQMPLLFALFQVFRSTIELRGAAFFLWIKDLSGPDTLVEIAGYPLNILPLLMVVTMLLQQKMTPMQGGAQQKTTMYIMNVFFLFLFYNFPSGLNLYYTLFNALTILQQKFLTPHTPIQIPVKTTKKKK